MANAKDFFEVFNDVKLDKELTELMKMVEIVRVTTNRDKTIIKVYIESTRLIPKAGIYAIEDAIKKQVFGYRNIEVRIIENYTLSAQYNAEKLWDVYKDSFLMELRRYSIVEYNIVKKAEIKFEDKVMELTVEDIVITKLKEPEIKRIIEKVFCERCRIPVEVRFKYIEATESKFRQQGDDKIKLEVQAIMDRKLASQGNRNHKSNEDENEFDKTTTGDSSNKSNDGKEIKGKVDNSGDLSKNSGGVSGKSAGSGFGFNKYSGRKSGYSGNYGSYKKSDNPDCVYGRDFDDATIDIKNIVSEMGEVVIRGKIISLDTREIRNEKTIVMFAVTDFTDSIMVKMFTRNEQLPEILSEVKKGAFIKLKGITMVDKFDRELTIASVTGIIKISDFTTKRMDTSIDKRIELHCHTKMSDMDGVSEAKDIIKRAIAWGHKGLAITDHGNVQGFTEAFHALRDIKGDYKKQDKVLDFKMIYGVEAYLVDDMKEIIQNSKNQSIDSSFVVFDLETTGFSPIYNKIIEIGAVKVENGHVVDSFSEFVNPEVPIPFKIENLTGITDSMVIDAKTIEDVLPRFLEFCEGCIMVAHNADFDMSFIEENAERLGIEVEKTVADTVSLARVLLPTLNRYKLDTVAKALGVSLQNHHRAVDDARCTSDIFMKFIEMLKERDAITLDAVNELAKSSTDNIKKMPTHHAIILIKNEIGRINLYKLISYSHIDYFNHQPRIPKSVYLKYSEGLMIGSACEAGELYQAIIGGRNEKEIARLVRFYDYLEIQPLGNNEFMLKTDDEKADAEKKYILFDSKEDLIKINKKIIELAKQFDKLVVATCDVHFLDPEDEVYRRIIMAGKGFKDADKQAPLYLRTTQEMLDEFYYLDSDTSEDVVINNPQKIADMIEQIEPVDPLKAPPVIPNSDQMLRDICYNKAHSMYGDELPEVVTERLERELNSIISNGYAVMYIIAQKLVWKSNEDGYLVGSRGSVGSSFVATMSGITEVNPLRPHYYCEHCHYSDFDSDYVKPYAGGSGCDMPDMNCPKCGEKMVKAGFDIPFETFLGFKGNKEPDIDLNFSGDYQAKAHDYTEVIFGKGQTFRAGTIGTLAEKTAFGYVKNYYEERGESKRNCEIDRIVQGCVGVRRTTGQHPGGIIVLPIGEEIYRFTPVQRPANDMNTKTVTTHFDYHSIDHNLLKLDILGHDDPTMIRMLEDLTGVDALDIPLDNKEVMSLFESTKALNIEPEDIGGCKLGALGIPEFGTEFVIQMLLDTKPKTFSDLIRISGLSHGTDVWLGNAQDLILEGKATISTAICTRDDIMTYLISKNMDSELSFTIMESVRKGKGLRDEWIDVMLEHGVPEWYIESCKKIKYMFPKAHAAAYVMMAFRIAYFKVFYPLAYYAAYFSIRASAFSYELMCQGKDKLEFHMKDFKRRDDLGETTKKEQDVMKDMKVVQEMYARGFQFMPIDIYKVDAHKFQIIDGKLMPSLSTIEGLGDKAADAVVEAAEQSRFLSRDDFREKTKVSKTVIDLMHDLGLLGDLPESNQLSLFDL